MKKDNPIGEFVFGDLKRKNKKRLKNLESFMTNQTTDTIKAFRKEFGIHFKPDELQFAEAFIEEALADERKKVLEEVRLEIACYSRIDDIKTKELIKIIKSLKKK